jgi:BASS family bile acid:Na+ symporter
MNEMMQFLEDTFGLLVLVFTISNLGTMGLQVNVEGVIKVLKNKRALLLIFVWGWIIGPTLAYFIIWILPLDEPYKVVVLLCSLAPVAPFLQQMVSKARGSMAFAGALIPLVTVGTVLLMPIMAPIMIKGVEINTWALSKPLLLTILLPLIIGAVTRHYVDTVATWSFPLIKLIAKLSTLLVAIWCLVLYGSSMLDTAGSFALLSMTLYMVGMAMITYYFGFGLKQAQRSVMALGMGTRNIAAVLAAALSIPNVDERIVTMVVMWTLWSVVLAAIGARIFAKQAIKIDDGVTS